MAMASEVKAAGLRILDGIVGRTDDAGRPWGEGFKWLAKHLVGGAAAERERRDCEEEKKPHRSTELAGTNSSDACC
jgi:hypothetical protein